MYASVASFVLASCSLAKHSFAYEQLTILNVSEPQNNAPLDIGLAYDVSQLYGYNGDTSKLTHSFIPVSCGANMSVYHTDPKVFKDAGCPEMPILLLNHGYPESSYIWRNVTPEVSKRVPVMVPDRQGYGLSTPCSNGSDELTGASAILEASNKIYGDNISVILAGHDRGGRTMHRAAVSIDRFPNVHALGVFMADIVPIVEEYASFSNPNYSQGYFHWAFLPRGKFAVDTIMAYGGGKWATYINHAGSGVNESAVNLFFADRTLEVYANFFNQLSVTNASVFDYAAAAFIDYEEQVADQAAGRKINMPAHVLYSYYNLKQESGFDVEGIWRNWTSPDMDITFGPVTGGQGHFIIEEAPDQAVAQLNAFMDRLGVASQSIS